MGAEPQTRKKGLRIATRCASLPQFISQFRRFCDAKSVFISTLATRPVGLETPFSIDLADRTPALRGLGVVIDAWETGENPFGRPGVHLGIRRLTKESEKVLEQLLVARAVANDRPAAPEPAAPVAPADASNTDVVSLPADERTKGSDFILPANPLSGIDDQSLGGFVDCTIFEETGSYFPIEPEELAAAAAADAADPPAEPPILAPIKRRAPSEPTAARVGAPTPPTPARTVTPTPPTPARTVTTTPTVPAAVVPRFPSQTPTTPAAIVPSRLAARTPANPSPIAAPPGSVPLNALAAAAAAQSVAEAISAADAVVPSDDAAIAAAAGPEPEPVSELRFPRPASDPAVDHASAVLHARRKSDSISGGFFAAAHSEPMSRLSPPPPPVVAEDLSPRVFEPRQPRRAWWRKAIEEYRWYSVGAACGVLVTVVIIAVVIPPKGSAAKPQPPVVEMQPPPPPSPKPVPPPPSAEEAEPESEGTAVVGKGPCRLTITSTPAGSIVAVDGERAGPSPITIAGPCAKRQVEVAHPRYAPATRTIELAQDKPETVDITLQRPMHHMMVETQPTGAIVSIAGKPAGSTPTNIDLMGFTTITLTIAKPGWRPVTKKIYSKVPNDHLSVKLSK